MEKVNKGLTDHVNYKEIQNKEADGTQRLKRDQRQREWSHEVRKKNWKTKGVNVERRVVWKRRLLCKLFDVWCFVAMHWKCLIMN